MRQVFLEKGLVKVREVCEPLLTDHTVLVSVHYSCVSSGTEAATVAKAQESIVTSLPQKLPKILKSLSEHGIEGTRLLLKEKLLGGTQTLGYSCSGQVIAVGKKVQHVTVGDFVACAGAAYAYHADVIAVPENLVVRVANQDYLQAASLTTLGAIALQGVRRAQLQLGETVCVVGLGLLGQLTIQLAKIAGCRVIGIDLRKDRLQLAQKLGADFVLQPEEANINNEINFLTEHIGVDTTIITAGSKSNSILQQAMEITRKKGRVVLVGDVGLNLERDPFYKKEIDFLISCSYGPGRYDADYEEKGIDYPIAYVRWTENRNMQTFVALVQEGRINTHDIITNVVPVDDVHKAYELLERQEAVTVVLAYHNKAEFLVDDVQQSNQSAQVVSFKPAIKDTIRVGVVGAGGFAKVKLMPIINSIKQVKINAIVDSNITTSVNLSKVFGAAKPLADDKELFAEDLVDAVLIASPHKFHCQQALNALHNGKAVFLEKPMVTDFEQLEQMRDFFKLNPQAPLCVDFNRSFAPFMRKIKNTVSKRSTPLVILYRMNVGFIPKDHWIQTEVGAGRIIGEACHIVELFCYLTGAKVAALSVETLRPITDNLLATDNFSVQFSFTDGSIATLFYTALGNMTLGKERMELFFDSKSIVMDDYVSLQGYGLPSSFSEKVVVPDKGHENLLNEFFACIKDASRPLPFTFEYLDHVANVTLLVDQLACQGGGEQSLL